MAGYSDGDKFRQEMEGGGSNIICMEHHAGIVGCPRCARAKALYQKADEAGESRDKPGPLRKEAKSFYKRKIYVCFARITAPGKPQHDQVCLTVIPTQQVEYILSSVQEKDLEIAWPCPDNLDTGHPLVMRKTEKTDGSGFAQYSTVQGPKAEPLEKEVWMPLLAQLPDLDNPYALQYVFDNWDKRNIFNPYGDMQKGESVRMRILPHSRRPGNTPFKQLLMHFVATPNQWEAAWQKVGYDPAQSSVVLADPGVRALLGMNDQQMSAPSDDGWSSGGRDMDNTPF